MALIRVPRPEDAYNPDRPMGSLLKTQVEHLREAESKLPLRYRHDIDAYIKAIKTEGEAAAYIRKVTDAIQEAHADAERGRRAPKRKPAPKRKRVIEIAAVASEGARHSRKRKHDASSSKKLKNTKRRAK
jgi:hypothetical protein